MSWKMFNSIRVKLTFWYVTVLAAFIILFSAAAYFALAKSLDAAMNERLAEMAASFVAAARAENEDRAGAGTISEASTREASEEFQFRDYRFTAYSADGREIATTADTAPPYDALMHRGPIGDFELGRERLRYFRTPLPLRGETGQLLVFHSLSEEEETLRLMRTIFLVGIPLALIFAGGGGYFLARKTLRPVTDIARQAEEISASNLETRILVENKNDELGLLTGVINRLLERLHLSFDRQRRFMADASHELRTPIAVVRGESEVAISKKDRSAADYRQSLDVVHEESRRLTTIVEELFMLARADANPAATHFKLVYLEEIAAEAVRSINVLALRQDIKVSFERGGEFQVLGDESLLIRLFMNLLDNAVKYNRPGGTIHVVCEEADGGCRVTVTDSGHGIDIADQPYVFERFYRGDKSRSRDRSGAGLGLSIAKWIAEQHGGGLDLVSSGPEGSEFVVILPTAAKNANAS